MKNAKNFVLRLLAVVILCGYACQEARASVLEIGENESGKDIITNIGDTVKIVLYSNPTTGYEWQFFIQSGQSNVEVIKDEFIPPKYDGRVGVGGKHIYMLKVLNAGEAEVTGYYYRPWERLDKVKDIGVKYRILVK